MTASHRVRPRPGRTAETRYVTASRVPCLRRDADAVTDGALGPPPKQETHRDAVKHPTNAKDH